MMQANAEVQPKYMSKVSWQICAAVSALLGIILVIVCLAVGGCTCDDLCEEYRSGSGSCSSLFGGCEKGSYDANRCAVVLLTSSSGSCVDPNGYCKTGGMSAGLFWFVLLIGIIALICSCVGCCGCMACCCFAPDPVAMQQGAPVVVVATQPGITGVPVVAEPGAPPGGAYQKNGVWHDANGNPVVSAIENLEERMW